MHARILYCHVNIPAAHEFYMPELRVIFFFFLSNLCKDCRREVHSSIGGKKEKGDPRVTRTDLDGKMASSGFRP